MRCCANSIGNYNTGVQYVAMLPSKGRSTAFAKGARRELVLCMRRLAHQASKDHAWRTRRTRRTKHATHGRHTRLTRHTKPTSTRGCQAHQSHQGLTDWRTIAACMADKPAPNGSPSLRPTSSNRNHVGQSPRQGPRRHEDDHRNPSSNDGRSKVSKLLS